MRLMRSASMVGLLLCVEENPRFSHVRRELGESSKPVPVRKQQPSRAQNHDLCRLVGGNVPSQRGDDGRRYAVVVKWNLVLVLAFVAVNQAG